MRKTTKYAVFSTNWGYCGIAGTRQGLVRTHLPAPDAGQVSARLLESLGRAEADKDFLTGVQELIAAYFEGDRVDFTDGVPVQLEHLSGLTLSVLTACRLVEFGRTTTYGKLAESLGRPNAARAVGNALAANPLPLIIPCHRVIRSDGEMGGFSAPGGTVLKGRLLLHEQSRPEQPEAARDESGHPTRGR